MQLHWGDNKINRKETAVFTERKVGAVLVTNVFVTTEYGVYGGT